MNHLTRDLPEEAWVLDLGAGPGSFDYASTRARVLAIDLTFPLQSQTCAGRAAADSAFLPLKDQCVDVVVCNHTWEHFPNIREAVLQINRVLKVGGHLWVAVPDGFSFDDGFYRWLFEGGGHVNRFSLSSLLRTAEAGTQLKAIQYKELYTGFVYLNPPSPEKLPYYPRRARTLGKIPSKFVHSGIRWLNFAVRVIDRCLNSSLSRYGWGVTFRREPVSNAPSTEPENLQSTASDLNVCFSCGAGHPEAVLRPSVKRWLLWQTYSCPSCGTCNIFVRNVRSARADHSV